MKNFIKFIFVFFIFLINFNQSTAAPVVPVVSGVHSVIEATYHKNDEYVAADFEIDKRYFLLRKNLFDCEISGVNSKNNTIGSGDNRFCLFSNNKLSLNYKYYFLTYILRNSHKISPILENAIVTRAP